MGVSRFMGSKGWVGQWNESFEHKKLMSSNYGPNTGEMGTIAYFTEQSKLGRDTLGKLEDELLRRGHRGDTALGFMIDDKGKPWPTEWTCRLGWPIANMMLGATKGDPVEWMRDALQGKDTTTFSEDIGCCLVLAHGDFPHGNFTKKQVSGVPVYGVTKGTAIHVHPQAVQIMKLPDQGPDGKGIVEREMWATAGDYVAVITGYGASVSQAAKRAYGTVEKLHVANPIVRDDVGEELRTQLPALHALGYALHCQYK
jgi:phosphoribosylamine-glycine ligase